VYEITDDWAKIEYNFDYAYVSANYIKKIDNPTTKSVHQASDTHAIMIGPISAKVMLIIIVCLSIVLFILRVCNDDDSLTGGVRITNVVLFIITVALELIYLYTISSKANDIEVIWFCIPDDVGWIWTIVNFIIFAAVLCNQMLCLVGIINDYEYKTGGNTRKIWGVCTLILGVIALTISLFFYKEAIGCILTILAICQLIQVVLFFIAIVPEGGWVDAIVCSVAYVLGVASFLWMVLFFFVLLLFVIVGCIVTYIAIYVMSTSSESSEEDSSEDN
jgi:hypothetical protein